jgi:hypothetical protein
MFLLVECLKLEIATYPNLAASVNANSITAPNELSVDVGDTNILNNNVAATRNPKTFALAKCTVQLGDGKCVVLRRH